MMIAIDAVDQLRSAGCTVLGPASRLEPAMTLAQAQAFEAAVLDVFLDGAYSWELAGTLAARGVPFILLTGLPARSNSRPPSWQCLASKSRSGPAP